LRIPQRSWVALLSQFVPGGFIHPAPVNVQVVAQELPRDFVPGD